MPTAKIIVNPYAGRWKARESVPQIETALARAGIPYELIVTQKPDDGIAAARTAALAGFSPIVAVGGDGACNEISNGLLAAAGQAHSVPMGLIPQGTANDLAFGLGIPEDIEAAVEIIARGNTRQIDAGRVNGRYFDNNSAIGLEPVVTLQNARLVAVKGTIRYLIAALICIARRPLWRMKLAWDDGEYEGSILLISVGNGRRTGGVFHMTPQAEYDDGLLDVVFAPAMSRLQLLRLMPQTFNGSHIQRPEVRYIRTTKLQIGSRPGTPIHTDGEVFELNAQEILYEVLPGKLTVLVKQA